MVVEYVRYVVPEKEGKAFERAHRRAQQSLAVSPHCLGYELTRCTESASYYVLRIEWDSPDGLLNGFRASREFEAFFDALRPFAYFIVEMRQYELTSVHGRRSDVHVPPVAPPGRRQWKHAPEAKARS